MSRRRLWLAAAAGALPLIPIIIGLFVVSGGGGATASVRDVFRPVAPAAPALAPTFPAAREAGVLVALVRHAGTMRASPGGRALAHLPTNTEFGSPEALWVVRRSGDWLGVVSPLAGNGRLGWIPQSVASLTRVDWQLTVSLAARRLTVLEAGRVIRRFAVAIGQPAAPTPTGRFAVTDRLFTGDPSGPYGCCILALSAHSPHAIQGWDGGDRIAVHSTPDTASIGRPVSHGCLRVTLAEGRWLMEHVPLATPAVIKR